MRPLVRFVLRGDRWLVLDPADRIVPGATVLVSLHEGGHRVETIASVEHTVTSPDGRALAYGLPARIR